ASERIVSRRRSIERPKVAELSSPEGFRKLEVIVILGWSKYAKVRDACSISLVRMSDCRRNSSPYKRVSSIIRSLIMDDASGEDDGSDEEATNPANCCDTVPSSPINGPGACGFDNPGRMFSVVTSKSLMIGTSPGVTEMFGCSSPWRAA